MKGRAVVDIFVVVAIGAVVMGRNQIVRHLAANSTVPSVSHPMTMTPPGVGFFDFAPARRRAPSRPAPRLVHDDVLATVKWGGLCDIVPRRQPDHLQSVEFRACPSRARLPRDQASAPRPAENAMRRAPAASNRREVHGDWIATAQASLRSAGAASPRAPARRRRVIDRVGVFLPSRLAA